MSDQDNLLRQIIEWERELKQNIISIYITAIVMAVAVLTGTLVLYLIILLCTT